MSPTHRRSTDREPAADAQPAEHRLHGTIVRVNADRGFCWIRTPAGVDHFCHATEIDQSLRQLEEGVTRASFDAVEHPKGPRATNAKVERRELRGDGPQRR